MELDDTTVHLKAGDVLVQRGTIQQLGQSRHLALCDRIRADRRKAVYRRWQGSQRAGLTKRPAAVVAARRLEGGTMRRA